MKSDKLKSWARETAVRAIKATAQTAIAAIGSVAVLGDVDWKLVTSTAALSGILSILTSIATNLPEFRGKEKENEKKS